MGLIHMSNPNKKRTVAYLTNIPTPYRVAMLDKWGEGNPDYKFSVFYTDEDDQGRGWLTSQLKSISEKRLPIILSTNKYGKLNAGLLSIAYSHDFIIIGGFEQLSYIALAFLSRALGKKVILLFDGFSPARFQKERMLVVFLKRLTAYLSDAFYSNGTAAKYYLKNYIKISDFKPVFNQYLAHAPEVGVHSGFLLDSEKKSSLLKVLGFSGNRLIAISCSYLIRRKRIDLVIEGLSKIDKKVRPELLVVGTGPEKDALCILAKKLEVNVCFVGFKQPSELETYYAVSDFLVLASEDDPWGLVVNEAMASQLPVIVSDACGAAYDLVHDDVNGYVFKNGDLNSLVKSLLKLMDKADLASFGIKSKEIVSHWNLDNSSSSLASCLNYLESDGNAMIKFNNCDISSTPITVIHERDGRKYMEALISLQKDLKIGRLSFVGASVFRKFVANLFKKRRDLFQASKELFEDLYFRLTSIFRRDEIFILGIAPWDFRIIFYAHLIIFNRVIYHTSWPHWSGSFLPRRYGVLTPLIKYFWIWFLSRPTVEVVAVTPNAALGFRKLFPLKSVDVIPHVVSENFLEKTANKASDFKILFVGELIENKGVNNFKAIIDGLDRENFEFHIVGDGELRSVVQDLASTHRSVVWHGYISSREKLSQLMSQSSLLLVPSVKSGTWEELFGMVLIEGMAVGLPVVAANHVGPALLIKNDVNGFLIDGGPAEYANKIMEIMQDEVLWARLSSGAKSLASEYSIKSVKKMWVTKLSEAD